MARSPGPIFYSEHFCHAGADANFRWVRTCRYSGSLTSNRSINKSLGGNLAWDPFDRLHVELDGHHSTAVSKPNNKFGTNMSVGNAVFGIADQTINYEHDLPVINVVMYPGVDALDPANITPTGNAFRTAYFKDRINQGQLKGNWDFDSSFLDSVDFGVSYVDNKLRSAFGVPSERYLGRRRPGVGYSGRYFHAGNPAGQIPGHFRAQRSGHDPVSSSRSISNGWWTSSTAFTAPAPTRRRERRPDEGCLAKFTVDRRIKERTLAPYLQANMKFDLFQRAVALPRRRSLRTTRRLTSTALVPVPNGTQWVAANEFNLKFGGDSAFTTLKGKYHEWLPAIDFDMEPIRNFKLRASYSHTITRADYASMQGGLTLDSLFRVGGGTGSQGNPGAIAVQVEEHRSVR